MAHHLHQVNDPAAFIHMLASKLQHGGELVILEPFPDVPVTNSTASSYRLLYSMENPNTVFPTLQNVTEWMKNVGITATRSFDLKLDTVRGSHVVIGIKGASITS